MSWANRLIETYDNYFRGGAPTNDETPLVPVDFVAQVISIRINLDRNGHFNSAQILENKVIESIPALPEAQGRTGIKPFPLNDQVKYIAGDLSSYSEKNFEKYYCSYISGLRKWVDFPDSPEEIHIVLKYVENRSFVSDLIQSGLIKLSKEGNIPGKYLDMFVSFSVFDGFSTFCPVNTQHQVIQSWQSFMLTKVGGKDLSYVSGLLSPSLYNHAKIENKAKLFSQKDDNNPFQYKGRFESYKQAYALSYIDSAKISNTLFWLRNQHSFKKCGMTFLTWSSKAKAVIPPLYDDEPETVITDTAEAYANAIHRKMMGYQSDIPYKNDGAIVMLGLEAATDGRMSVTYYEELGGAQYLATLEKWYIRCSWVIYRENKRTGQSYLTFGTPMPHEIATAVYGAEAVSTALKDKKVEKSVTKFIKKLYNDLVICIVNGRPVPAEYTREAYKRVFSPSSFTDGKGNWQRINWEKNIAVTLALLKSSFEKEDYHVALDKECTDRSYLFGRLVAVADIVETRAMSGSDSEWRQTNAVRYFNAMQQRPAVTWQTIETKLIPYYKQLREKGGYLAHLADEIYLLGKPEEMSQNKPLSPKFLEGYHNQRYDLTKRKEN